MLVIAFINPFVDTAEEITKLQDEFTSEATLHNKQSLLSDTSWIKTIFLTHSTTLKKGKQGVYDKKKKNQFGNEEKNKKQDASCGLLNSYHTMSKKCRKK